VNSVFPQPSTEKSLTTRIALPCADVGSCCVQVYIEREEYPVKGQRGELTHGKKEIHVAEFKSSKSPDYVGLALIACLSIVIHAAKQFTHYPFSCQRLHPIFIDLLRPMRQHRRSRSVEKKSRRPSPSSSSSR
jgi:hypothetical protein